MEGEGRGRSFHRCILLALLVSQGATNLVMCRSLEWPEDENSYSPILCHSSRRAHRKPPCETPSPSTGGSSGSPMPSHRGGGYYNSPPSGGSSSPTPVIITPPSSPGAEPVTPTPLVPPTPTTPRISTPPSPLIPDPNAPPSPLIPDPNTPPLIIGPVIYWQTHPAAIWAICGYLGTISQFFGVVATSAFGRNLSVLEALANTRRDGTGALYREGTASFLNSMANKKFVFSTQQVRDAFSAALVSDTAAAAQAELFKQANEGRFKKQK